MTSSVLSFGGGGDGGCGSNTLRQVELLLTFLLATVWSSSTQPWPPPSSPDPAMRPRIQLVVQVVALIVVIQAWLMLIQERAFHHHHQRHISYAPMFHRNRERIANLNYIYNCNNTEALWMLRMKRAPFARLVETFRSRELLEDSIHANVEEQVVMFLHVVGHNQRFRVIHNTFRRSMETISRYFKQAMYVFGELREEMIKSPIDHTPSKICGSHRWYPYFKDCIGAIDGTHVAARVPRSQSAAYRGRKHYTSQNVLAAVDFDLKFTYVHAGWEGSAHDANILTDSMSRPDGIKIPDGKFYLGDAGYAYRPGVLPPFRKIRYHLNEFSNRNYLRTPQELFNLRHSSLRVTVERTFEALKNMWKILDQKPFHPFPTQVKLVLDCCILHNML